MMCFTVICEQEEMSAVCD